MPTSGDGPDDESNLALACRARNLCKSDQRGGMDETTQDDIRLFHPPISMVETSTRIRLESEDGAIQGLTDIDRVTVGAADEPTRSTAVKDAAQALPVNRPQRGSVPGRMVHPTKAYLAS